MLSVAIQPTNSNVVLAGLERGGIFKSTDGGQTWKRSTRGLVPEASVSDIVFDPTNPAMVLYLADLNSGVYRSVDGGNSWTAINQGLMTRSVNALALSDDGLHLYAASEGSGVYRLDLNGKPPESVTVPQPVGTASSYQYSGAGAATAAPAATQYQYQFGTPTPSATGSGRPPVCGSALVPIGLIGVVMCWKRGRSAARLAEDGAPPHSR